MPASSDALTHAAAASSAIWLPWVIQLPYERAETSMPDRPRWRYSMGRTVPGWSYARVVATGDPDPEIGGEAEQSLGSGSTLRVHKALAIPMSEITWRATTSGGPGGQHANRTLSRVEVQFDVEGSAALGPRQRARLRERYGSVV